MRIFKDFKLSRQKYPLNQSFKCQQITHLIFVLILIVIKVQSVILQTPLPSLYYDNEMLEMDSHLFNQGMNSVASPNYRAQTTITFTKMNKNLPNSYEAYVSWRGTHIFFHQQALGAASYALGIIQINQTNMKIAVSADHGNLFMHMVGIYLLIHQSLVTNKLMYGEQFFIDVDCVGAAPLLAVCDYPKAFAMESTGYTALVFVRYLRFYRDVLDLGVNFSVQIVDPNNINIKLQFGQMGKVEEFAVSVVVYKDTLADPLIKKSLMLASIQTPIPVTTLSLTNYGIPLAPLNVYSSSMFVGLTRILCRQMQLWYDVFPDLATLSIKGYIYFPTSIAYYQGFVLYGYKCSDPYYFSESSQQCEICPIINCQSCAADILGVVSCTKCIDNYFISADKLSCQCNMDIIASVCDTLIFPDQLGCVNAQRVTGDVQCLFCSPTQFKKLSNNKCQCMNGYHDDNHDGICQEICGDGLIFNAQCDDGNINPKDGCSPTCTLQEGFNCDRSQPSYCQTLTMLRYKFGEVKKLESENKAQITLFVKNLKENLPFSVLTEQFLPESSPIKLFFLTNQGQSQQVEITDINLVQIDGNYSIRLVFGYDLTLESFEGKIVLDYEKTRYLPDSQEIKFNMEGIDRPLIYSDNLQTFETISYGFLALTCLNYVGFIFSFMTPKFIGLESILTLQLIFYSQMLIDDPSKWPVGFMYFKYLKSSSGFNKIFHFTEYKTLTVSAKKYFHLQIQKTVIQNFNINFLLLLLSFIVFIIIFLIKYKKQSEFQKHQFNRKYRQKGEYQPINVNKLLIQIEKWKKICDKAFWVVNYFVFWLILPLIASLSSQVMIQNNLVTVNPLNFVDQLFKGLGLMVGSASMIIIFIICLNHFMNLWLSRQSMRKLSLKPQETKYKRLLFIYLLVIGMMVLFFNKTKLSGFPFSVLVLFFQIAYTILLMFINPYRQSLRIHTVTLLINQGIYILFLLLVNLVNLIENINEIFIVVFGYAITILCLISVILSGIRLFYQLKHGEALEKQIQKERQRQEQEGQLKKQQLYKKRMKKLKNLTLEHQSDSQKLRAKNRFLYQNQIKQDKAKDMIEWLDRRKWDPQDKEKYFIQKSTFQPLQWLQTHDREQFQKQIAQKQIQDKIRLERKEKIKNDEDYKIVTQKLKQQVNRNVDSWNKKLQNHERRIKKDLNYVMDMKKDDNDRYIKLQYALKK